MSFIKRLFETQRDICAQQTKISLRNRSLIRFFIVVEETLHPWLSKNASSEDFDLMCKWAHTSEWCMFSDIAFHFISLILCLCGSNIYKTAWVSHWEFPKLPLKRLMKLSHTINWKSSFTILGMSGYVRHVDILKEKYLNYLQTVETLIRRRVLRRLIWACTVCQLPFRGLQSSMG